MWILKKARGGKAPNKALLPTMILTRFNGHQSLTEDEVSHAPIQQPKKDLAVFR